MPIPPDRAATAFPPPTFHQQPAWKGWRLARWHTAGLAGLLAATLLAACSKPPPPPPPTPTPTPIPTPIPTPRPTPTPTPTPTPPPTPTPKPTPTPVVKHYAPAGVYFVTQDITVRLPTGLLGVVAGTRVQSVADKGETMQVTDGRDTFEVKKSQLTNEIEAATTMQQQAAAAQAATDEYQAQSNLLLQKQQQQYIEFLKAHPLAVPTPTATPQGR